MKTKDVKPQLLKWLLSGHTITNNQALKRWKTSRLATYIFRIREEGKYKITTEIVKEKNSDTYAKYSIKI